MVAIVTEKEAEMFSDDRDWLHHQPGMNPWEDGCRRLTALLDERLTEYSRMVCEQPADLSDDERTQTYRKRLWRCLGHHWQDAIRVTPASETKAEDVLGRLAEGRGYRGAGRLGGNPLRDVVLALAMTLRDEQAPRVFEKDYLPLACGLAGKINYRLAKNHQEWWNDLLDHLAGYTGGSAKLDTFLGDSGLTNWLPKVVCRFLMTGLIRESKRRGKSDMPDIGVTERTTVNSDTVDESLRRFVEVVAEAVRALPDDDSLLFKLLYVEKMKQKDVAGVFQIAAGNVTRRHTNAIKRLRELVTDLAQKRLDPEAYDSLLRHSIGDAQAFAKALCDALQTLGDVLEERQEDES